VKEPATSWQFEDSYPDFTARTDFFRSLLGAEKARSSLPMRVTDPVFREQHLLYSINGLIEGNLPLLTMKKRERVRWYLMSNSNEDDVHTAHWHGQTVLFNHMRTDTLPLAPMGMAVADMVPDKEGTWLLHCHVNDHLNGACRPCSKCSLKNMHLRGQSEENNLRRSRPVDGLRLTLDKAIRV
jgi:hypothetical protein